MTEEENTKGPEGDSTNHGLPPPVSKNPKVTPHYKRGPSSVFKTFIEQ